MGSGSIKTNYQGSTNPLQRFKVMEINPELEGYKKRVIQQVHSQASRCQDGDFMTVTEPYVLVKDLELIIKTV